MTEPRIESEHNNSGSFDVFLCDGGPMLIRGDAVIEDESGVKHKTHRKLSAVCRCGLSAIKPWCDGSHKIAKNSPSQ